MSIPAEEKGDTVWRGLIGSIVIGGTFFIAFSAIRTIPRKFDNLVSPDVPQPIKEYNFFEQQHPNLERIYCMVLSFGIHTNRSKVDSVVRRVYLPQYVFAHNSHIEGKLPCASVEFV